MRQHHILPAPQMRQARSHLMAHGVAPSCGVDARVSRSWGRSLAAGLSPTGRISTLDNLSAPDLERSRSLNHELISHSQPVMEYLLEQVRNTQSMVILADHRGVLMHTMGDLDFLDKASRVALLCGASWHESQRGTNAIGTALAERDEVEIHAGEHFLERNGFLTCAAAPILSSAGQLLGVLDISGDQRNRHPHTQGLVGTAARMIENSLMQGASRDHLLLALHTRPEGIGSIAQALLAFSPDGWLVGGNRRALELFGLAADSLRAHTWDQLFDTGWHELLAHAARHSERALALRARGGAQVYARLRVPLNARAAAATGSAPVALASGAGQALAQTSPHPPARAHAHEPAPAADCALRQLDTGDAGLRAAIDKALRVCDKAIPILLTGESGVGKELFAQAIHASSARRDKPFVAINCAAIPEHLIEAELFGHVAGAFTGAARGGSAGRLREADGGTLFLDELGDMPLALQTRLLRVLQERRVTPLGSGAGVAVDFALVCATNQDLPQAVQRGRFRADLYYRVNGLALRLPPLRERSDFAALTKRILHEAAQGEAVTVAPELLQALARHPWPGNLRQYSHVLRTAVALLEPHQGCIGWAHLPDDLAHELLPLAQPQGAAPEAPPQNLAELSQRAIAQALENCRGNVSAAARQLGISRQTLYRRLKER